MRKQKMVLTQTGHKDHSDAMQPGSIYFIAIVLPEKIREQVQVFKDDFKKRFRSEKASKVITHITLKAPFKSGSDKTKELLQWFERMDTGVKPFTIELKDFGAFDNRRNPVVFINPVLSAELRQLQKSVIQHFTTAYPGIELISNELDYKPHITIAYRDLDTRNFQKAWTEYKMKEYRSSFIADSFHLLEHDKRKWNIISTNHLRFSEAV
jgi:2'-5' RNA ligase